jgi:RND family efflux transporter MFP subunit
MFCGQNGGASRLPRGALARSSVVGLLVAVALALSGCPENTPPPPKKPASVTVSKPVVREVTEYFEFPGQTDAVNEVAIRARVTGYIVKVNFEDGQDVKKDDLLFEIDPRPYQAVLDRARGDLARLEATQEKAEVDLARSERLRPSGAVSEDEYEQHVAQLKIAKASIASLKAAVTEAELNLGFTKITSPIEGRVSRARIREGNLVQGSGNDSAVLTTVVTIDPIYVCFSVDEHALLRYKQIALRSGKELHPGSLKEFRIPIEIGLASEEGFPHAGVLDFADNKVDCETGTIRVRGVFANENEYLTPGLFVRVRIPYGDPHPALLVDKNAICTNQSQKYLKTVNGKNVVEHRPVKLGPLRDGLRVIASGIGADDLVVVKGLQQARENAAVAPHFAAEKAAEKGIAAAPPPERVGKLDGAAKAATN